MMDGVKETVVMCRKALEKTAIGMTFDQRLELVQAMTRELNATILSGTFHSWFGMDPEEFEALDLVTAIELTDRLLTDPEFAREMRWHCRNRTYLPGMDMSLPEFVEYLKLKHRADRRDCVKCGEEVFGKDLCSDCK